MRFRVAISQFPSGTTAVGGCAPEERFGTVVVPAVRPLRSEFFAVGARGPGWSTETGAPVAGVKPFRLGPTRPVDRRLLDRENGPEGGKPNLDNRSVARGPFCPSPGSGILDHRAYPSPTPTHYCVCETDYSFRETISIFFGIELRIKQLEWCPYTTSVARPKNVSERSSCSPSVRFHPRFFRQ